MPNSVAGSGSTAAPREHVSGQSNMPLSRPAHSLGSDDTLRELEADQHAGLTAQDAQQRLTQIGPNELEQKKGVQPIKIFIEQIFNAMTLVGWPLDFCSARLIKR